MKTETCEGLCRDFFASAAGAAWVEHEVRDDDMIPRTFVFVPEEGQVTRYEADSVDVMALHAGQLRAGETIMLRRPGVGPVM